MNKIVLTTFGREQICASCVGAPGSKDTYEWLQAAIGRKYDTKEIYYEYIDIDKDVYPTQYEILVEQIKQDELFYPLIMLNDEIIAEGIPHLKRIFKELEVEGVQQLL